MQHILKGGQISCHSHSHGSKKKKHIKYYPVYEVRTSSALAAFLMCICGVALTDTLWVKEIWPLWTAQSKLRDGQQEDAFLPLHKTQHLIVHIMVLWTWLDQ